MSRLFRSEYSRRDFLNISLASAMGASYSGWLPKLAHAAVENSRQPACILLWMNGGPSQTDTFDLKPGHKNGGPFMEIDTKVPGIRISEHLPGLAQHADKLAIIRSMTSTEGDHGRAGYLMRTGYRQEGAVQYPSLGSIVAKEIGPADNELPNFVSISPFRFGAAGGPGFLGPEFSPLTVSGESNDPTSRANLSVENLAPPAHVDKKSMESRFGILGFLQSEFTNKYVTDSAKAHQANYERAERMVKSQAKHAFQLEDEQPALRDAYGRNRFGQGCLLARRLVERGVPFVEVTLAGVGGNALSWDSHTNNFETVQSLSEVLDPGWSTLMTDLKDRGLLDSTLVIWMGEFGRTPTINPNVGRDHFPLAWSTVLAGGGIKAGQVIGSTGDSGMKVEDRPVTVPEYYATICSALKIDPTSENISDQGRPIKLVDGSGSPVKELLANTPA